MRGGNYFDLLVDLIFVAGLLAACFGLWQIYQPAAWLFGGLVAMAVGVAMARGRRGQHGGGGQ